MQKLLLLIRTATALATLCIAPVSYASVDIERSQSEFITAADAFQSGQYEKALELYKTIETRGHESADLYFNLGNTYTRLSKPGLAIKAYREALYRAPRSADLQANLAFVRGKTTDAIKPPAPSTMATTLAFFHFQLSTSEKWIALIVLNVLFWFSWLGVRHLSNDGLRALRGLSLISAVALAGSLSAELLTPRNDLVITTPKTEARAGLDAKSLTRFTLHEGAELKVQEVRDGFARVTLPESDESGWVSLADAAVVPSR